MIYRLDEKHVVFWDEPTEQPVGEPAIILTRYADVLEIKQRGSEVMVSLEKVDELIKAIRLATKVEK